MGDSPELRPGLEVGDQVLVARSSYRPEGEVWEAQPRGGKGGPSTLVFYREPPQFLAKPQLLEKLVHPNIARFEEFGFVEGQPVLRREGVGYDSSLLPGRGFLFLPGRPGLPPGPHPLAGGEGMWEFPPTTVRLPGISFPAAGGAFLRILPRRFVMQALHRAASGGGTPHVYLHPWELGVSGAAPRLLAILQRFQGVAIDDLRVRLEERGAA